MSDIDQNEQRRFQFLQAMYDLAYGTPNGTPSNRVLGPDVAERLGLDINGEQFYALARYHVTAGNIESFESNWGRLALTNKGIAEVESQR